MDTTDTDTMTLDAVASNPHIKSIDQPPTTDYDAIMQEVLDNGSVTSKEKTSVIPTEIESRATTEEEAVEKAAARKARLKAARNIRFTVEHSNSNVEVKQEIKAVQEVIQRDMLDEVSMTAISTPTQYDNNEDSMELEEITVPDIDIEEEDADKLLQLDTFDDDDDDDGYEERGSVKGGDSIGAKKFFLENFEIPAIEDISDDDVAALQDRLKSLISIQRSASQIIEDKGKFVDPLTGETISSSSSSSSSKAPVLSSMSSTSSEDLFEIKSMDDFKKDVTMDDDADIMFQRFESSFVGHAEPVHTVDMDRMKAKNYASQIAVDFLNDLIRNVVTTAENIKEELRFNNAFNKVQLHDRLSDLINQYSIEKTLNGYLNTKMVEYTKRTKNERSLGKLPPELNEKERERFMEALAKLDFNLLVMAETKKKTAYLLSSVLMDLSYLQNICLHSEQVLNDRMLEVLGRRSEYLRKLTERELRLMGQKRNEISDTRLFLITRKHTLGRISDKIHKLEQINEDISMDDFIMLQNQVAALHKKIEERNVDLKKARLVYHASLHMTQHNREKIQSFAAKLIVYNQELRKVQDTQRELREKLYNAKLERQQMRKINSDLTYQGGLLALPSLMYDYDETVERVRVGQANVNEMKEIHARINSRIVELESRIGKSVSIAITI